MRIPVLLCFLSVALGANLGPLANFAQTINDERSRMHYGDLILSNPHMRDFDQRYFVNMQEDNSRGKFAILANELSNAQAKLKHSFPFAGYNSLDTNLYNRFTKENVENEKLHKIGNLLDEIRHLKDKTFPVYTQVNPLQVAKLKHQIKQVDKVFIRFIYFL